MVLNSKATKRRSDEATKGNAFASPRCAPPSSSPSSLGRSVARSLASSGFTLTELLVVIGLIVLILAIAVPSFSFITGSASLDGAQNQIAAMLGRARSEAIGLQEGDEVVAHPGEGIEAGDRVRPAR